MRIFIIFLVIAACLGLVFMSQYKEVHTEPAVVGADALTSAVKEESHPKLDIIAILDKKCRSCHGRDKTKGSFNIVRLLESGVKQEEVDYWNEVYRAINEEDMPPEDEEQLSDLEKITILDSLKEKLKSSNKVSRLLTAKEITQTLADVFNIDIQNDNQMDNLFSYQDGEHYSSINNEKIMSVFFMNDYSQILNGVIDEYVNLEKGQHVARKNSPKKKKSVFDPRQLEINSVGFASRSHYWPEKDFVDLRGRYSPHANALKEKGERNLNLEPGLYKLSFDAAAFNRKAIKEVKDAYSNEMRLLKEKAKVNIYVMPVYNRTRPSPFGKQKLVESIFIEDDTFKNYTFEIEVKRSTPVGLEFENGPHSGGRLKSAFGGGYPKDGPPPKNYKYPYIRFKNMTLTLLKPASNELCVDEKIMNEQGVRGKLSKLISKLGLSLDVEGIMSVYRNLVDNGIDPFDAYKKSIKSVFLSPNFLYVENFGTEQNKMRFASYNLLKSYPDKSFASKYQSRADSESFIKYLTEHRNFQRFSDNFVYEWLHLSEMAQNQPDEGHYKEFYMENLNYAFNEQTKLFVNHLFKEKRPVSDIIQSDYTFVNDNLSRFYGLGISNDTKFRKASLSDRSLGGLITQGSFLTATSNGVEALPFHRAVWISENILNQKVPPPPDNISVQEFEEAKGTFAEKMKVHSTNKACNTCHKMIDPIADKMRYFDGIGKVEKHFPKTEVLSDVKSLKDKYMKYERKTAIAFCKNLLAFSTGRKTDISDYETIEKIVEESRQEDYAVTKIFEGVIKYYF